MKHGKVEKGLKHHGWDHMGEHKRQVHGAQT